MFKMPILCRLKARQAEGSPLADHFVLKAPAQTGKHSEAGAGVLAASYQSRKYPYGQDGTENRVR